MAVTAHVFPKFEQNLGAKAISLSSDTLACLLIASGTYTWNSTAQGHQFVSDFLAGSGGGALTEVSTSGTGYGRQNLTSVSWSTAGLVSTLTCANPAWSSSTISAAYALFYDNTPATDATRQLICYWDFGGTVSSSSGTFTLQINGSGLVTCTAS